MAAHRIIRSNQLQQRQQQVLLPRCRSEGTLIDLNPEVKVPPPPPRPRALTSDAPSSAATGSSKPREVSGGGGKQRREVMGGEQEVVALRDYHPGSFTTLRFNRGEHLYVLDASGDDWWFAHNNQEMGYIPAAYVSPLEGAATAESSRRRSDTVVTPPGGVLLAESSRRSDTVTPLGGGLAGSSHLSDSGMICDGADGDDWLLGEWVGLSFKDAAPAPPPPPPPNGNPFGMKPFVIDGGVSLDQSVVVAVNRGVSLGERVRVGRKSSDLITFDPVPLLLLPHSDDSCDSNAGASGGPAVASCGPVQNNTRPDQSPSSSSLRNKRSFSLSELSVLQALQSNPLLPPSTSGFFATGLTGGAPAPDQFGSRAQYRAAWLNHRKLARSCHDLCSLGQNPGWGQTQPVETHTVCRLDANGGVVQLPDTHVSVHVPAGHVAHGDHQHIALKALLEPPVELNTDRVSSVSPVLEIKLSNMDTNTFITLEMKVNVTLKRDAPGGGCSAEVVCVRSNSRDGPYAPIPDAYVYKDTVQARLDGPEPCTYVALVVRAVPPPPAGRATPRQHRYDSVWDHMQKTVTLGLYGPKHIHPSFKAVAAMFAHDCAPKTLLVNEVGGAGQAGSAPPVVLHLWGKHQFVLASPQDLQVGLYSNMSQYEVQAGDGGPGDGGPGGEGRSRVIRGFQLKLGKVIRHVFSIACHSEVLSDFTLRVQVKDALGCVLAQFCVQTPPPPPGGQTRSCSHQTRRFLRKAEVKDKITLSPVAASCKYLHYQDRHVTNLKFCRLIKTVKRQHKSPTYLLEYKKGDVMALLSEDKITLRGQLWTKEWYVGYYQGKVGLVHVKNVVVLGKVKPVFWSGPDLTSSILLEQILKPCKFLTYIYASVRTLLMENVSSWRVFAEALGYRDAPLDFFCRVEVDSEPERVASVLEKLKEECTSNLELKERRSFQRELMMALLKMDCQGLVSRLLCDCVLLTTAVEVSSRWRELAEKLVRMSTQQMEAYEAPHRDHAGALDTEAMWKPAYDFLLTWASNVGDSHRDVLQELHVGLDRMRNPPTRRWRHLTGSLVLVHCLDLLRCTSFCPPDGGDLDYPV